VSVLQVCWLQETARSIAEETAAGNSDQSQYTLGA